MSLGNVLVMGSQGVGKSTLIKAVVGSDIPTTGGGKFGGLAVYDNLSVPFRIIDAGDPGSSWCARMRAAHSLKRWAAETALDGDPDNDISVIWYCVEGKSRKLIREQIMHLGRATESWRHAPVIVVITKSYSEFERDDNVELIRQACSRRKRLKENLLAVIPVVADTYKLSETTFVSPTGVDELIYATAETMPEAMVTAGQDVIDFSLRRRRAVAHSIVAASTAAGVTVGAVPIPISDALILTPIETAEVNALATLYGIGKGSSSKRLLSTILEVGTVSMAAKAAISTLKAIPGINLAASVLNAVIAGSIVAAIGEGSLHIFERIYKGEKTIDDTEWVQSVLESRLSKELLSQGTKALGKASGVSSVSGKEQRKEIAKLLQGLLEAEKQADGEQS